MTCLCQNLPDDVVRSIVAFIPPIEIVHPKWRLVSKRFSAIVHHRIRLIRHVDLTDRSLVSEEANVPSLLPFLFSSCSSRLVNLSLPASILHELTSIRHEPDNPLLPCLRDLTVVFGGDEESQHALGCMKNLCPCDVRVHLEVHVSSGHPTAIAQFRDTSLAIRTMAESIDLILLDSTSHGQCWQPPMILNAAKDEFFVSYVRVVLQAGLSINRLELRDELKTRQLHMENDYKACTELCVAYSVGSVAPENTASYSLLTTAFLLTSSPPIIQELMHYLRCAPNLCNLQFS